MGRRKFRRLRPELTKRQALANRYQAEGWTVFDTARNFPDLLCVKNGELKFVKIYNPDMSGDGLDAALAAMKSAGVDIEIKGPVPKNPNHNGHRVVKGVSFQPDDKPVLSKLQQLLKIEGKDFSTWGREQAIDYVTKNLYLSA